MPGTNLPNAPLCPECRTQMKNATYGMMPPEDDDDDNFINMGCLIDEDLAKFACPSCGCQILESGLVFNPNKGAD